MTNPYDPNQGQPPQGYPPQQQGGYPQQQGYPQPGYPPQPQGYPPGYGYPYAAPTTSGMAIAGFVLSFFCALLGIIFSAMAISEINQSNGMKTGKGLAIAGLVISICSIFINLAIMASMK
jgi:hypothetical protein